MAQIRYYIGNVGSGKSTEMYRELLENGRKSMYSSDCARTMLVVPEQYSMQAQSMLLDISRQSEGCASQAGTDTAAVISPKVYSFKRLAYELFDKYSGYETQQIGELSRLLILKLITGRLSGDEDFAVDCSKQGNLTALKSVIAELEQYQISVEDLSYVMSELDKNMPDYKRLSFISRIYEKYLAYVSEQGLCFDILPQACEIADKNEYFKDAVIGFDEFNGFTKAQLVMLRMMSGQAKALCFTLTVSDKALLLGRSSIYDGRLFYPAIRSYRDINEYVYRADSQVQLIECTYEDKSKIHLQDIREHFLRGGNKKSCKHSNIFLTEAASIEEELKTLCEEINQLIRNEGYSYKDITVVIPDMANYKPYIKDFGNSYDIPFLMDEREPVSRHVSVQYLKQLLAVIESGYSGYSVVALAKNPLSGFEQREIWELENYYLRTGMQGLKGLRSLGESDNAAAAGAARIYDVICDLAAVFATKDGLLQARADEISERLSAILHSEALKANAERLIEGLDESDRAGSIRSFEVVFNQLRELLDEIKELFGSEMLSIKEYTDIFSAAVSVSSTGDIPALYDAVIIKDLMHSRHRRSSRAVFVIGMSEGSLPRSNSENALFNNRLKRKMEEKGFLLSDNLEQDIMIQCYELYRNLLMANERLYLSYPKSDSLNETLRPAYLLEELIGSISEGCVRTMSTDLNKDKLAKAVCSRAAAMELIAARREYLSRNGWLELLRGELKLAAGDGEISAADKYDYSRRSILLQGVSLLPDDIAARLYYRKIFSISQLESYAACPYAHFLKYGLRLRERERFQLRAADYGSILHYAMEFVQRYLKNEGLSFKRLSDSVIERLAGDALAFAISGSVAADGTELRLKYGRLLKIIQRALRIQREQMLPGSFELYSFEQEMRVDMDGISLRGIIDRIDLYEAGSMLRVIDYKSGARELEDELLSEGLQLQLPLYMHFAMENIGNALNKPLKPNGINYFRLYDPIIDEQDSDEQTELSRLKAFRLTGKFNSEAEHLIAIDNGFASDDAGILKGGYSSCIINSGTKKNGELLARTPKEDTHSLNKIIDSSVSKARSFCKGIMAGDIRIAPSKISGFDACRYCSFGSLCRLSDRGL